MSSGTCFGFAGDFLTFLGGVILAFDALREERKLNKIKDWAATVESPALAKVVITRKGVELHSEEDVELTFLRQSFKRALVGTLILTSGFVCLFIARILELTNSIEKG
jgi:hypothetical protein